MGCGPRIHYALGFWATRSGGGRGKAASVRESRECPSFRNVAALAAAEPARLSHFSALRDLPVNHSCSAAEALDRIAKALLEREVLDGSEVRQLIDGETLEAMPASILANSRRVAPRRAELEAAR